MMTGAQALVAALQQQKVDTIFGYPGVAICPFYDCMMDSSIRHILVRQEQNSGHAASEAKPDFVYDNVKALLQDLI